MTDTGTYVHGVRIVVDNRLPTNQMAFAQLPPVVDEGHMKIKAALGDMDPLIGKLARSITQTLTLFWVGVLQNGSASEVEKRLRQPQSKQRKLMLKEVAEDEEFPDLIGRLESLCDMRDAVVHADYNHSYYLGGEPFWLHRNRKNQDVRVSVSLSKQALEDVQKLLDDLGAWMRKRVILSPMGTAI